jgi:hypothetical protein
MAIYAYDMPIGRNQLRVTGPTILVDSIGIGISSPTEKLDVTGPFNREIIPGLMEAFSRQEIFQQLSLVATTALIADGMQLREERSRAQGILIWTISAPRYNCKIILIRKFISSFPVTICAWVPIAETAPGK